MSGRRGLALAALAAALLACPDTDPVPGDVVLGTFRFTLEPFQDGCGFDSAPDAGATFVPPGPFTATLSYDSTTRAAWLTAGSASYQGLLEEDGRFVVEAQASRELPGRWVVQADAGVFQRGCPGTLVERIEGRLSTDPSGACGALLPDAGAAPDAAFVQRVCGYLSDQFSALDNAGCTWDPCLVVYAISGERQ